MGKHMFKNFCRKKHKPAMTALIIIIIIIVVAFIINAFFCSNIISTKSYKLNNTKTNSSLHFVLISDLHNKEFGKNNIELVKAIKNQNPDFIAVDGDMVSKGNTDDSIMKTLLSQISKIAPTYCSLGNHELELADKISFKEDINNTGAVLLDNTSTEFVKSGKKILIGGLSDFPYYEYNAPNYDTPERYFWDDFKNKSKNQYSILLNHQPEYIADIAKNSNIDLILCGHTHGGQVQIPFIGGLYAPNQGFFPKYDYGMFEFGKTKMIISSGLGSAYAVPRINDPVEICVIDIK